MRRRKAQTGDTLRDSLTPPAAAKCIRAAGAGQQEASLLLSGNVERNPGMPKEFAIEVDADGATLQDLPTDAPLTPDNLIECVRAWLKDTRGLELRTLGIKATQNDIPRDVNALNWDKILLILNSAQPPTLVIASKVHDVGLGQQVQQLQQQMQDQQLERQQLQQQMQQQMQDQQLERRELVIAIQKLRNTATKAAHIGKDYVKTSKLHPSVVEVLLALPAGFDKEKFLNHIINKVPPLKVVNSEDEVQKYWMELFLATRKYVADNVEGVCMEAEKFKPKRQKSGHKQRELTFIEDTHKIGFHNPPGVPDISGLVGKLVLWSKKVWSGELKKSLAGMNEYETALGQLAETCHTVFSQQQQEARQQFLGFVADAETVEFFLFARGGTAPQYPCVRTGRVPLQPDGVLLVLGLVHAEAHTLGYKAGAHPTELALDSGAGTISNLQRLCYMPDSTSGTQVFSGDLRLGTGDPVRAVLKVSNATDHEVDILERLACKGVSNVPKVVAYGTWQWLSLRYFIMTPAGIDWSGLDNMAQVVTEVAGTLGAAWAAGIAHRDVKPDNVVLCEDKACLLDFHVACPTEDRNELESQLTGTPLFQSLRHLLPGVVHNLADDLESLLYCCIALSITGNLPWDKSVRVEWCLQMKESHMGVLWQQLLARCQEEHRAVIEALYGVFFPGMVHWSRLEPMAYPSAEQVQLAVKVQH